VFTHLVVYRGSMTTHAHWRVRLDDRRRPTLPEELLAAAGIPGGAELTARVIDEGMIVLETRDAVRERIRRRMAPLRSGASMVDELLAERRAEVAREGR